MKEREGIDTMFDDHCFITYKVYDDNTAFVFDMYSDKKVRATGYMLDFCNKFCDMLREINVKEVYGNTDTRTIGWERSNKVLLDYGFEYIGNDLKDECLRNYCKEL